ncbi:HTH-type transcriptional repressor Bm3R1 [Alphaproteobacteria bacterium SO-S41]|nr:HTH-type transcriptional repressor Bm3R1 [Alphaproteobacteria bacterium SO-S41]
MIALGKRLKILDGALAVFEAKGFHAAAVPEIAAASSVAVGTIYRHFPTKEALGEALLAAWQERFNADVLAPYPATATPRAALRLTWRRMAGFARSFPAAQRFLDLHHHASYAGPASAAAEAALHQGMRELADWGRRQGVMKPLPPEALTALLRGSLAGLARYAAVAGVIPQTLIDDMEDCLWNAVATRT